jgi:hypothetical protein
MSVCRLQVLIIVNLFKSQLHVRTASENLLFFTVQGLAINECGEGVLYKYKFCQFNPEINNIYRYCQLSPYIFRLVIRSGTREKIQPNFLKHL